MANNPNLYNAVIAGATGANQQRWLTSGVQADYVSFQSAVVALAGAVDAAIAPIGGDANVAQAALMQSIVQGVFADRFIQSTLQVSYESIVGPIVALWNELGDSLEPPTGGGSVGDGMVYVKYVDPGTAVAPGEQGGTETNPYSTIAAAFAALPADGGTIILGPGDYSGEGPLAFAAKPITLQCIQEDSTQSLLCNLPNITSAAQLALIGCGRSDGTIDTTALVILIDCTLSATAAVTTIDTCVFINTLSEGDVTCDVFRGYGYSVQTRSCGVDGTVTAPNGVTTENTVINAAVTGGLSLNGGSCGSVTATGGSVSLVNAASVSNVIDCSAIDCTDSSVNQCVCTGTATLRNSSLTGPFEAAVINASDCRFDGDISLTDADLFSQFTACYVQRLASWRNVRMNGGQLLGALGALTPLVMELTGVTLPEGGDGIASDTLILQSCSLGTAVTGSQLLSLIGCNFLEGQQHALLASAIGIMRFESTYLPADTLIAGDSNITGIQTDESSWFHILKEAIVFPTISPEGVTFIDLREAAEQLTWAPAGGDSNVLTLLPAGHPPGIYDISPVIVVNTAAGAGTANPTIGFTSTFGAETLATGTSSLTTTGTKLTATRPIVSNGVAAITLQFVAAGITGNPEVDVWGGCRLVQALPIPVP